MRDTNARHRANAPANAPAFGNLHPHHHQGFRRSHRRRTSRRPRAAHPRIHPDATHANILHQSYRACTPPSARRARVHTRASHAPRRIASHRIPSHRIASRRTHHETTLTNRTGLHGDGVRRTRIGGFEGFDFVLGIGHCFVKSRREVVARCGGRARNFPLGWNYRS